MEFFRKYKTTGILSLTALFLILFFLLLPSKTKVKNIKIKTIEVDIPIISIQAYHIKNSSLVTYNFKTQEDSYSKLITATVNDIIEKSKLNKNKLSLLDIYFSDDSIYLKFNNKNLDPLFKEAVQKSLLDLLGETEISFI